MSQEENQDPNQDQAAEPSGPPDTIVIENLGDFANLVARWHAHGVGQLRRLLEVPPGTSFEVGEQDITLSGDVLKGFKFGIEMAIMAVGTLPFAAEVEQDEGAKPH